MQRGFAAQKGKFLFTNGEAALYKIVRNTLALSKTLFSE